MRSFIVFLLAWCCIALIQAQDYTFYALSNDKENTEPIYLCKLDGSTGEFSILNRFPGVYSGNYFALNKDKSTLLVTGNSPTKKVAGIVQFSIDPNGNLLKVKEQFKPGGMPCYVAFTKDENYALSADYGDSELSLYSYKNGMVSSEIDNRTLPKKSRGHYITSDPSGKNVHAVFLGLDQVRNYTIKDGKFVNNPKQAYFSVTKGLGPRHLVFHETKPFAYILNEVASSVTACAYNSSEGTFKELQTISMLPEAFTEFSKAAAIRIHPNGKFLYASNRGHNSIAVYKIKRNGKLKLVEIEGSGIDFPRDFILTPNGKWMIIGNEHGDSVISYKVDEKSGKLTPTAHKMAIPRPLAFMILN